MAVFGDSEHYRCGVSLSFLVDRRTEFYSSFHFMACMNQRWGLREAGGKERWGEGAHMQIVICHLFGDSQPGHFIVRE